MSLFNEKVQEFAADLGASQHVIFRKPSATEIRRVRVLISNSKPPPTLAIAAKGFIHEGH